MKVIKKNQIVIFVIALMLITAGYLNFIDTKKLDSENIQTSTESIGDAKLVSSNALVENDSLQGNDESVVDKNKENILDAISNYATNTEETLDDEYFTSTKLERDKMYSQIIESYQKMIDANTITAEQKAIAQNEITKINNKKNAIMIAENLLKTKGFYNNVILVNNESVNVIIDKNNPSHEEIAQVQNIISRELETKIENIHISNK